MCYSFYTLLHSPTFLWECCAFLSTWGWYPRILCYVTTRGPFFFYDDGVSESLPMFWHILYTIGLCMESHLVRVHIDLLQLEFRCWSPPVSNMFNYHSSMDIGWPQDICWDISYVSSNGLTKSNSFSTVHSLHRRGDQETLVLWFVIAIYKMELRVMRYYSMK